MAAEQATESETSPAMEQLERGNLAEAERLAREAVAAAEKAHGTGSHEYAAAQHDLGMVVSTGGDLEGALDAFR